MAAGFVQRGDTDSADREDGESPASEAAHLPRYFTRAERIRGATSPDKKLEQSELLPVVQYSNVKTIHSDVERHVQSNEAGGCAVGSEGQRFSAFSHVFIDVATGFCTDDVATSP
ncbi:hypothetical protein R1flu_001594 [Riccia fluitans]|uniref:Uncharacterized protein n=1 Tax=Riccia fluitans TaxID=41844 RepID=A0ABD1Y3Q2_9MARC